MELLKINFLLLNSNLEKTADISDFDSAYTTLELRILFGVIENTAYISFDIIWIRIQLRCDLDSIEMRNIYGSSPVPEWKTIYTK